MANKMGSHTQKNRSEFSIRLGKTRVEKNLTQAELAERAETSSSMISNYEKGEKQPKITSAAKLAAALDVSLDYLCGLGPQSVYERNPVLAWLEAIKALRMDIKSVGDDEVVFTFKEIIDKKSGIEISGREIKRFFEEYKKFQIVADTYAEIPDGEVIVDTAERHLLSRFKNLPRIPPYDVVKDEKE